MQHHDFEPDLAARLMDVGVSDPANSARLLTQLAGNGVTDDDIAPLIPLLLDALGDSPDPDRSLNAFARWFGALGSPYSHLQTLLAHPVALELFCLITGSSQYFGDLLIHHPEYFEILANRGVRGGTKTSAHFQREAAALVDACQQPQLKKDALRRWKAREMLRIGVRDLADLADMSSTAREFSNLADACVQQALKIALATLPTLQSNFQVRTDSGAGAETCPIRETVPTGDPVPLPFCVIALGKLGGQELNYSSDIDLMFVTGDDLPPEIRLETGRAMETSAWMNRLGETLIKVLSEETSNGHIFRVDMRLRPEGRFGPLVRSLSSCRTYYENWAENWERQALLKVRCIAGDRSLGAAFDDMVTAFVYRPTVSAEFVEDVRANKRRIEQKCALEGETETNIKTGFGGIRDVEFIVQLYQLEFGGRYPHLRTPNTMSALVRLRHAGFITASAARELADDYQFLRTLEHRLQLLHQFQTQTMPTATDHRERTFLARRMGYPDRPAFEMDLSHRRERVHEYLDQLFYGARLVPNLEGPQSSAEWADIGDLLDNLESPAVQEQLSARLRLAGFTDTTSALRALQLPMRGNEFGGMPPDTPQEFKTIAPRLLRLLADSPQPDQGLAGLEALALAVPNRAHLYASMDDSPDLMAKIVTLSASSPPLMMRLVHHPEWTDGVFGEEEEEVPTPTASANREFMKELDDRVAAVRGMERQLEAVARYYLRETTRIGAHDVWYWEPATRTMSALTRLADAVLANLLRICARPIVESNPDPAATQEILDHVTVMGLGKLGGAELSYASDWDLIFVYSDLPRNSTIGAELRSSLAHKLVESVNNATHRLASYGAGIEIDLRLRPWGRKGAIVLTPRAYLDYLKASSEIWERQAALKARFVAGDATLGRRMERIFQAASFGQGATAEQIREIVEMKQRIETERLKPGERETDLKLGYGGLSDIEWLVQRMQLEHGGSIHALRETNTVRAIAALASAQLLVREEADLLSETYQFLTRLRNGLWLLSGQPRDNLNDPGHLRALARRLGYDDTASLSAQERLRSDTRSHMSAVRIVFERRFQA